MVSGLQKCKIFFLNILFFVCSYSHVHVHHVQKVDRPAPAPAAPKIEQAIHAPVAQAVPQAQSLVTPKVVSDIFDSFCDMKTGNDFYSQEYFTYNATWHFVNNLYKNAIGNGLHYAAKPRIPKIIHQVWLGSQIPEKYNAFRASWKKHNPGWEYMLWTDKEIDSFGLVNRRMYDEATNYGEKSDIARYEILYRVGGLYVDTDFECLKSFDILHHCCDLYAGLSQSGEIISFNGLIGAAPSHPVLEKCIKDMNRHENNGNKPEDTLRRTGPMFFTRCFLAAAGRDERKDVLFAPYYFYPWPWNYKDESFDTKTSHWVTSKSFAVHHWHVSWANGAIRSGDSLLLASLRKMMLS